MTSLDDDFLQYLFNMLNEGYVEYKKNHPDFARVVEKEEGKPEESYRNEETQEKDGHCLTCGEWLQGFDMCPECGRINK